MSSVVVDIRRLERGDFLVKVNKKKKICTSIMEAAAWAERQLEAMQEPPAGPGPAK